MLIILDGGISLKGTVWHSVVAHDCTPNSLETETERVKIWEACLGYEVNLWIYVLKGIRTSEQTSKQTKNPARTLALCVSFLVVLLRFLAKKKPRLCFLTYTHASSAAARFLSAPVMPLSHRPHDIHFVHPFTMNNEPSRQTCFLYTSLSGRYSVKSTQAMRRYLAVSAHSDAVYFSLTQLIWEMSTHWGRILKSLGIYGGYFYRGHSVKQKLTVTKIVTWQANS